MPPIVSNSFVQAPSWSAVNGTITVSFNSGSLGFGNLGPNPDQFVSRLMVQIPWTLPQGNIYAFTVKKLTLKPGPIGITDGLKFGLPTFMVESPMFENPNYNENNNDVTYNAGIMISPEYDLVFDTSNNDFWSMKTTTIYPNAGPFYYLNAGTLPINLRISYFNDSPVTDPVNYYVLDVIDDGSNVNPTIADIILYR